VPEEYDDRQLNELLFPTTSGGKPKQRASVDFAEIHRQLNLRIGTDSSPSSHLFLTSFSKPVFTLKVVPTRFNVFGSEHAALPIVPLMHTLDRNRRTLAGHFIFMPCNPMHAG
jgi:hypothetical protein